MKPTLQLKHLGKLLLQSDYRRRYLALQKLRDTPRYTPTYTDLLGTEIGLVDAASFLFMYEEIFERQIYKFKAKNQQPTIIDCGSNIGLSILYFKQLYPNSHVVAFEPDVKVFKVLEDNVQKLELPDVKLVNKAVWSSETILEFMSEGADGGRVIQLESNRERYQVPTTRLRDYLNEPVDFIKLDIEGSETEVIKDCKDLLYNVDNFFVEYHSFANESQTLHLLLNILFEAGFRLHIHPAVTSPQPFYHRNLNTGMDMQLNIFAFRE
jgi:FkbM family methyltransferase